jgi:hypothetical protein
LRFGSARKSFVDLVRRQGAPEPLVNSGPRFVAGGFISAEERRRRPV